MKFTDRGLKWKRWLSLMGIWLLVPGGTLIVLAWLLVKDVRLEKNLAAYYDTEFGEFRKSERSRKEAKDDIHTVRNK